MLDNSFSYCSNENCTKKDLCLRYTKRENVLYGQTYLSISEEQSKKCQCFINKDEYYIKMINDIIDKVPNDNLDKKLLLDSCYKLLSLAEQYNLKDNLLAKIKFLEQME